MSDSSVRDMGQAIHGTGYCGTSAENQSVSEPPRRWGPILTRVQNGDSEATEQLFRWFEPGLKGFFGTRIGWADTEDRIQDVFVVVLSAIQEQRIIQPEALPGFVYAIAHRMTFATYQRRANRRELPADATLAHRYRDNRPNGEELLLAAERDQVVTRTLDKLSAKDREILERFYLMRQTPAQIMAEMELTETQYRLLKSRAKAKLTAKAQTQQRRDAMRCALTGGALQSSAVA